MSEASPANPYRRTPLGSKVVGSVYGSGGGADGILSKLTEEEIEELRRILLAPEQYQLMQLHRRLDELEAPDAQLNSLSKYLPEAVAINARKGDKLAKALSQTFSRTLDVTVQQDTETMVEGISPLVVPALRRGIRESFRSTRNAIKWALQYGVSLQGIKWQIEAMRSGRSFSEVVLSHTLRYRVEQVFLIHRISGLPLQHVVADSVKAQDGSLVSSMLTAIQDFVQDSFGTKAEEGLATLQVGELTVWIEQGPKAIWPLLSVVHQNLNYVVCSKRLRVRFICSLMPRSHSSTVILRHLRLPSLSSNLSSYHITRFQLVQFLRYFGQSLAVWWFGWLPWLFSLCGITSIGKITCRSSRTSPAL